MSDTTPLRDASAAVRWGQRLAILLTAVLLWGGLTTASTFAQARVQIIHNSPDPRASTVDIYVDDGADPFVDDLSFRGATGFVNVPPGTREIDVAPQSSSGPGDAVYTQNVTVQDGETYVAIATGELDLSGTGDGDFQLLLKTDARESVSTTDGDVELFGVHGSPDAPTVDVQTNDGTTTLLNDISYTDQQPPSGGGYASIGAGTYTLDVNRTSDGVTLTTFGADLSGLGDQVFAALASGYVTPDDEPFSTTPLGFRLIVVDTDGNVQTLAPQARAQIIHNSPDPSASTVDIYVDNSSSPFVGGLSFRDATGYVNVPAGTREFDIAPGGSSGPDDAVATQNVTFEAGNTYTVIASGVLNTTNFEDNPDGVNRDFQLLAVPGARETPETPGNAEFFVVHGATDAPTVDAFVPGGPTLADDAAYTDATSYASVAPGTYPVSITGPNQTISLATFTAPLTNAGTAVVLASGFYTPYNDPSGGNQTEPAFGLLAVFADGSTSLLPVQNDLAINEFLADPTADGGGVDANGDGSIEASEDEFVEVINRSGDPVDLSGYQILDSDGNQYTFPPNTTIPAGNSATVFGGGTPTGIPGFTDTGLPALNNTGDDIILEDDQGNVVQSLTYPVSGAVPESDGVSTARNVNAVGGFAPQNAFGTQTAASPGQNNDSGQALPVELAGFSARLDGKDAVLTWRTLSETNNSGFAVQHRAGKESAFERVGFREGQGSTSEATPYRFRVADLQAGTHDFRLKQIDVDGSASLTDVVTVEVALDEAFTWTRVAPNPVSGVGTLSMQVRETQDVTVEVYDVLGRRVRTLHDGPMPSGSRYQMTLDTGTLAGGTYLLRVDGESFSDTQRVTVVK